MRQGKELTTSRIVLVAVGSSLPTKTSDSKEIVTLAVERLVDEFDAVQVSTLYQTPAFPKGSGPDYVNGACAFETFQSAASILTTLHQIEAEFDRTRDVRWAGRTLDLDLIACGDEIAPDRVGFDHWRSMPLDRQMQEAPDRLILPHPRLQDRSFVLVPLADIAPEWVHPVLGQTVQQMADARPAAERAEVRPLP